VSPRTQTWDQPTVRLNQGDLTLFQSLGDPALRSACLVLYSGSEPGRRFDLHEGTLSVGRAPDCTLSLLESAGVSRRHAELQVVGDTVQLRDTGSANGTHVNERRVEGKVKLKDGDMLRLGDVLLKYFQRASVDALLHDRIYRMATVDAGTEVFSKRYVMDALEREIRQSRRSGRPLSVLCLDLDHFKTVNDRWGHNAGDHVLRESAAAILGGVRAGDIVGRIGGEEFLVVLPGAVLAEAQALAERVRAAMAARTMTLGQRDGSEVQHQQTVSIGVAVLAPEMNGARQLLDAADARLYSAKGAGRNRVET
jgi:diguanylate cyclase (GGDEF)-like protein